MDLFSGSRSQITSFVARQQALAVLKGLERSPYVGRRCPQWLRYELNRSGDTVNRRARLRGVQLRGLRFTSLEIESMASEFMPMY